MINLVTGGEFNGTPLSEVQGFLYMGDFQINNRSIKRHEILNRTSETVTQRNSQRQSNRVSMGRGFRYSTGGGGSRSTTYSTSYKTFTIALHLINGKTSIVKVDEEVYEMLLGSMHNDPAYIDLTDIEVRHNGRKIGKPKSKKVKIVAFLAVIWVVGYTISHNDTPVDATDKPDNKQTVTENEAAQKPATQKPVTQKPAAPKVEPPSYMTAEKFNKIYLGMTEKEVRAIILDKNGNLGNFFDYGGADPVTGDVNFDMTTKKGTLVQFHFTNGKLTSYSWLDNRVGETEIDPNHCESAEYRSQGTDHWVNYSLSDNNTSGKCKY